jgi:phospholipid/cholesterol/gamma-HCH transport system ATP-binding protein
MDTRPPTGNQAQGELVIRARGLVNRFGDTTVHEGVDLELPRGSIMALVGGSGSGKSVLLRTLTLLREPQGGSLELFGEDALVADPALRTRLRTRIGVLFQGGALFTGLSVLENVVLALHEHGSLEPRMLPEVAMLKIGLAGLPADAAHKFPAELSGGMVKRAALARALALDPELLVLDEPTSGLDPVGAAAFDQLIAQLRELLGLTVLQVTHDLDSIWHGSDLVAFLARKRVLAVGSARELAEREEPELIEYLRGGRSSAFWRSARGAAPGAVCSRADP